MMETISSLADILPDTKRLIGYMLIFILIRLVHSFLKQNNKSSSTTNSTSTSTPQSPSSITPNNNRNNNEEEEEDPPRNFTTQQLKYFDGTKDPNTDHDKPIYLSLHGKVFDVTSGRDFYGPEGPYATFAGRECGIALAKMSFDTTYLDDVVGCDALNHGEKCELENWMMKFEHYRGYPIKGRLVSNKQMPNPDRVLTKDQLVSYKGDGYENGDDQNGTPNEYATKSIYIGAKGKVYDVSFGGSSFYSIGCPYHVFAGKDASRALAKMSLKEEDANNPDISDLNEKEMKVLDDWVNTFENRKKYPVVGVLKD